MKKKILINKIIKGEYGERKLKVWTIQLTEKEKLAEAKKKRIEKNKPYRGLSRNNLIDEVVRLKEEIKDISYQLDDLS